MNIGHRDIKQLGNYKELYSKRDDKGNNCGKIKKVQHLMTAYNLKNQLAGEMTDNRDSVVVRLKRDFLNKYITKIQHEVNNGNMISNIDLVAYEVASEISNIDWKSTALMEEPKTEIDFNELTKLAKEFVEKVIILARHATDSNTKTNWFGITNETSSIQLLKHGENCKKYLAKMEKQGYIQKEKNVSNPSHEIIGKQRMKTQKEYELETAIDNVNAIVMSLREISDSPALLYQDNQVFYSSIEDGKYILIPSHTNGSPDLQLFKNNVLENISPNIGTTKEKLIKAMSSTLNNDFPLFETEVSTKINQQTIELSAIARLKSEIEEDIIKLNLFMTDENKNFVTFNHYPSLGCDHEIRYGNTHKTTVGFDKEVMEGLQILNQDFINKEALLNQELRNLKQELIAIKVGEYFLLESKPDLIYL